MQFNYEVLFRRLLIPPRLFILVRPNGVNPRKLCSVGVLLSTVIRGHFVRALQSRVGHRAMANIGAAPQSSAWPLSPLPLTPDRSSGLSPAVSSLRHLIAQRTEELTHLGDARAAALAQRVRDLENELSRVLALHGNIQESAHATSAALAERDAALAAAQRELARRELALTNARDAAEAARDAALADLSAAHERVQEAVSAAAAADAARESLAKEMLDALRCVSVSLTEVVCGS